MELEENDIQRVISGQIKMTYKKQNKYNPATESQKETLIKFDKYLKSIGKTLRRRYLYVTYLRHLIVEDLKVEFDNITVDVLKEYFLRLYDGKKSKNSIKQYRINIRFFLRWLYDDEENYKHQMKLKKLEKFLKEIKPNSTDSKNRGAQRSLKFISLEQVELMQKYCDNIRDEAMLICLWECGFRAQEFLSIDIQDIKYVGGKIIFDHPDLRKSVKLIRSEPFLKKWLDIHPNRRSKEGALWTSKKTKRMGYQNLLRIVKTIGNRAGIRDANVHMLRHSFGTFWAPKVKEHVLKTMMGHASTSSVTRYYVHLKMEDAWKAQAAAEGFESDDSDTEITDIFRPKICRKCAFHNSHDSDFCNKCGEAISEGGENLVGKQDKTIKTLTVAILKIKRDMDEIQKYNTPEVRRTLKKLEKVPAEEFDKLLEKYD